jgi:hypothetical protein
MPNHAHIGTPTARTCGLRRARPFGYPHGRQTDSTARYLPGLTLLITGDWLWPSRYSQRIQNRISWQLPGHRKTPGWPLRHRVSPQVAPEAARSTGRPPAVAPAHFQPVRPNQTSPTGRVSLCLNGPCDQVRIDSPGNRSLWQEPATVPNSPRTVLNNTQQLRRRQARQQGRHRLRCNLHASHTTT